MSPTGRIPWRFYSDNAHRADLPEGWYLFVHRTNGVWRWAVNAPPDPNQNPDDRYRQAEDEGRVGVLEPGKTLRDAKKAAEAVALEQIPSLVAGGPHG